MDMSPEDGALLGLSTLGPGNYFKHPDKIVGKDGTQAAARSFDKELLNRLVSDGLAVYDQKWEGYALSQTGGRRVAHIMLIETPMEPLHAIEALVKICGASVGIRKGVDEVFIVTIVVMDTAYVAADKDLGKAVLQAKRKVDERLIG